MTETFSMIQLSTQYSDADERRREVLLAEIQAIWQEYRDKVEPFQKELVDIESRYAPRCVLVNNADSKEPPK